MATTLSIVVPCYNEESSLPALMARLDSVVMALAPEFAIDVLCVDDGSTDGTAEVVRRLSTDRTWLRMVSHDYNRGLGTSIRTAIDNSRGALIAMLDADGTFPPEVLPLLLRRLLEGYDIVIGSPYHPEGGVDNVPRLRLFVSRSLSVVYRFLTRSDVYSFSGIFRVYRREVFNDVQITGHGFASVSEILIEAMACGHRIAEVPTILSGRMTGTSKLRFWPEVRNHLRLLKSLLFNQRVRVAQSRARATNTQE